MDTVSCTKMVVAKCFGCRGIGCNRFGGASNVDERQARSKLDSSHCFFHLMSLQLSGTHSQFNMPVAVSEIAGKVAGAEAKGLRPPDPVGSASLLTFRAAARSWFGTSVRPLNDAD